MIIIIKLNYNVLDLDTDKGNEEMNTEQINMHLVQRASEICERVIKRRKGHQISDIMLPICYKEYSLVKNINNVLACFSNTLEAALFRESEHIKALNKLEMLSSVANNASYLILGFLIENGLEERFKEYLSEKTAEQ
jgi:hypothetical protein